MRYQLLFCLLLLLGITTWSQDEAERRLQKLRPQLKDLQGADRVSCLNDIAQCMMFSSFTKWDSSLFYSRLAIDEARKIDFKKGLGRALITHGDGLLQFQHSQEAEKYFREAIFVAQQEDNEYLLAMAHRRLGQSLWYQGWFQQALPEINSTIPFFEKSGNDFQLINCYTTIADIYNDWGNYEQGFAWSQKALALSEGKKDDANTIQCYVMLGALYAGIGDYETAFSYNTIAAARVGNCNDCYHKRALLIMKGNLHRSLGNYDSSMYYLLKGYKGNPTSTLTKLYIAETLLAQQRYDTALQILTYLKEFDKQNGAAAKRWRLNTVIGAAYFGMKDYDKAMQYTRDGLDFAYQQGIRGQFIPNAFQLLSSVYKEKGKYDSALYYLERYAQVRDSVISDQLKGKLFEYKRIAEVERKQAQIALLEKQKQISEQQLIGGIILILLLSAATLLYVSSKRKNERLKSQQMQSHLQHKATELEMQALRAQMNPHFIFNCLSSINRFILKNETEAASDYLTRFSRLIRLVLVHSSSSLILLKDEIDMLRLYLEMEQLRFKNAFDYQVSFSSIDPETIYIPPLLLQPFCENSIWHGLVHKEGKGNLSIRMSLDQQQLTCIIEDDGIGRAKASTFKSRSGELQRSLGLKITGERLALINKEKGVHTSYEIEDLVNENGIGMGTKVKLRIRYSRQVEEVV